MGKAVGATLMVLMLFVASARAGGLDAFAPKGPSLDPAHARQMANVCLGEIRRRTGQSTKMSLFGPCLTDGEYRGIHATANGWEINFSVGHPNTDHLSHAESFLRGKPTVLVTCTFDARAKLISFLDQSIRVGDMRMDGLCYGRGSLWN